MRTFIDINNELHVLEDDVEFDQFIKDDWRLLSKEELKELEDKESSSLLINKKLNTVIKINNMVSEFITSGFKSSSLGEEYYYKSTVVDQNNILQNIICNIPSNCKVSKDNLEFINIEHTVKQLKQVNSDFIKHRDNAIYKGKVLKDMVNKIETIEAFETLVLEL